MALDPTVIVAGVAAAGAVGSAWVSTRNHRDLKSTLGHKNGEGDVMEVLYFLKHWVRLHEARHADESSRSGVSDMDYIRWCPGCKQHHTT